MRHLGTLAIMGLMSMATQQATSQQAPPPPKGESASVSEVWNREDEGDRYANAGDVEAYKSLYHEQFIGWSCGWAHPKRKAGVGSWVREVRDKHIKAISEITREGAEDFGNVVIVHYRASEVDTYPDGHTEGEGEVVKITHTWMRTGNTWQIIGGMCASVSDNPK